MAIRDTYYCDYDNYCNEKYSLNEYKEKKYCENHLKEITRNELQINCEHKKMSDFDIFQQCGGYYALQNYCLDCEATANTISVKGNDIYKYFLKKQEEYLNNKEELK